MSRLHRAKLLSWLPLSAAVLMVLPLRSDGVPDACANSTTSLASTQNNPVAGDEQFFTLPVGPSNVMFMLDTSGSMDQLPQCGDGSWGDTDPLGTCVWPTFSSASSVTTPSSVGLNVSGNGFCDVHGNASLKWMHGYTPTATYVDPGLGTAANGLADTPPWGNGCSGNNCLFQADKTYAYGSWDETSATPTDGCTVATFPDYDCTDPNHPVAKTVSVKPPGCENCLHGTSGAGFFFFNGWSYAYRANKLSGGKCSGTTTGSKNGGSNTVLFSGGWLNANPPKFMSARKVIKQSVWIDPDRVAATDQLRFGLSYVSTGITNNAAIVVPLGPSQADSYPVSPSGMVAARQLVINALNHTWPSGVNLPSLRNGGTPMATGLFHVGQYFAAPGLYTSAFGSSSYELNAFKQTSTGLMNAGWVDGTSKTICWSCQKSAVIIVTDGSPNTEMTFPSTIQSEAASVYGLTVNCGGPTASCSSDPAKNNRCCSPTDSSSPSRLPRVASWLHNHDLRTAEFTGDQTLIVSPVSFNLPAGNAQNILQATANMSGGSFNNAADGKELAAKVAQAVAQVSTSATTFGAPAASALTTIHASNTKAFVTRFKPNQRATWEGHLFQWMLFDEAAAGCNPAKKPDSSDLTQQVVCRGKTVPANFNGDTTSDGYNVCTGIFLVDKDCDEVVEDPDGTGLWFKKGSGKVAANVFWDAGESLSYPTYPSTSPRSGQPVAGYTTAAEPETTGNIAPASKFAPGKSPRTLWTALPDGTMKELETRNAAALAPFMNLDQAWCTSFEQLARLCGGSGPTCPATRSGITWQTYCAEQVILFARGWDVLDQDVDGCAGPGNPSNGSGSTSNTLADGTTRDCVITAGASGEERDRANDKNATSPSFFKLADVFHSSPVLLHPPASVGACQYGIDSQCVRTLFGFTSNETYASGYQTPLDTYAAPSCRSGGARVDAYHRWRTTLDTRRSAVLVGSNDGFLHAFDAGVPGVPISGDTVILDDDCMPQDTTDGNGQELWGFLPTDLLPRLRDTLLNHQYMVDGNVMVRDVWLDGASNGQGDVSDVSRDGKKQQAEFHTVAVFTERNGGTQFTALDVTDITRPKLLWTFPPPLSADAQWMGQSWSDFAPRPPPIGPVRIATKDGDPDPLARGWLEKWVVMVNGGYDPTLNRGRAVWMLDVADGSVLWRFTNADVHDGGKLKLTTDASMFPVPAAVGLVDIGDPARTPFDSDNFFDTATWGDMGGNLWVARFDVPGKRDANGVVTNWRASRAFEQRRRTDDAQLAPGRSEFFYMTSNVYEPQRRALRTMIGSGNRERILEQSKGCAPDNLFSCCQASCTVTTTASNAYGSACSSTSSFTCDSSGKMAGGSPSGCGSGAASCTGSTPPFTSTASYALDCGSGIKTTASGSATCSSAGLCTVSPAGTGHDLVPSGSGCDRSRFYGIWSYGGAGATEKTFSTALTADWTAAQTFDQNRFTDVDGYVGCAFTTAKRCSLVNVSQAQVAKDGTVTCASGSVCQATVDDAGWYYEYNSGLCPTKEACPSGCTSEKSASSATVTRSCTTWNSFLPKGSAAAGTDPCRSVGTASQVAVAYASNFVSGVPDASCNESSDSTNLFRGTQRATIAPPSAPMVRYGISPLGQVHYSAMQFDPGRPPSSTDLGTRDIVEPLYWLEVTREAHNCRHGSAANCQ